MHEEEEEEDGLVEARCISAIFIRSLFDYNIASVSGSLFDYKIAPVIRSLFDYNMATHQVSFRVT